MIKFFQNLSGIRWSIKIIQCILPSIHLGLVLASISTQTDPGNFFVENSEDD
jgi:hypothetical protein